VLLDLVGIGICCALEKSFKRRQVIIFWVSGFLWRLSTCQKQSQDKFSFLYFDAKNRDGPHKSHSGNNATFLFPSSPRVKPVG
jgi:hypothetical protein